MPSKNKRIEKSSLLIQQSLRGRQRVQVDKNKDQLSSLFKLKQHNTKQKE